MGEWPTLKLANRVESLGEGAAEVNLIEDHQAVVASQPGMDGAHTV